MTKSVTPDAYGVLTEPATLTIKRILPGPLECVWRNDKLTDPPGQRPAGFSGEHKMQSRIVEVEPPRKLAFTFGNSGEVSFELEPNGDNVLFTVIHRRLPDRGTIMKV